MDSYNKILTTVMKEKEYSSCSQLRNSKLLHFTDPLSGEAATVAASPLKRVSNVDRLPRRCHPHGDVSGHSNGQVMSNKQPTNGKPSTH